MAPVHTAWYRHDDRMLLRYIFAWSRSVEGHRAVITARERREYLAGLLECLVPSACSVGLAFLLEGFHISPQGDQVKWAFHSARFLSELE